MATGTGHPAFFDGEIKMAKELKLVNVTFGGYNSFIVPASDVGALIAILAKADVVQVRYDDSSASPYLVKTDDKVEFSLVDANTVITYEDLKAINKAIAAEKAALDEQSNVHAGE